MTTQRDALDRRTVLKMAAVGVATTALAGCSSNSDTDGSGDGGGSDNSGGDDSGSDESGDTGNGGDSGGSSDDYDFGDWFDGVGNYDGVADETGSDEVTISVGAEGNGGGFAFGPAAVAVSSGTTVVWEWTGDGGSHNVSADGGAFESETTGESGHTFEHTFEESGTYKYVCVPHETMGMKGAIVVE